MLFPCFPSSSIHPSSAYSVQGRISSSYKDASLGGIGKMRACVCLGGLKRDKGKVKPPTRQSSLFTHFSCVYLALVVHALWHDFPLARLGQLRPGLALSRSLRSSFQYTQLGGLLVPHLKASSSPSSSDSLTGHRRRHSISSIQWRIDPL
jgi:hypothetical protein